MGRAQGTVEQSRFLSPGTGRARSLPCCQDHPCLHDAVTDRARRHYDSSRFACVASLAFAGALLATAGGARGDEPAAETPIVFTDVTVAAGIEFVETIGDDRMTNIVESTGVGCGFVDYDGDGHLDIYLVNGCWKEGISDPGLGPERRAELAGATDRLYRNRGDGTFEDVTAAAGLKRPGFGMAVVAADYDGDGDRDLYVTNHGANFLYRNNGDGTFTETGASAGVDDPLFSVGAVFLDYDHDNRLDLYVGNYITYDPSITPEHARDVVRSPLAYAGQQDHLYHNNGDGTFTDVTQRAGLLIRPVGRAMGVGALDCDGDGFVSNDAMENYLLHNDRDGTFENHALMAGTAFSESGAGAAAMAVEVADYDADGRLDILVPDMDMCCLYHNLGQGMFEDTAVRSGIGAAVNRQHSWGGILADLDLDGDLDAYLANGHACELAAQPNCLFRGDGRGRFAIVSDRGVNVSMGKGVAATMQGETPGTSNRPPTSDFVSRGVARGDFDNDGDIDLLVSNLNARPALLRNDTPRNGRHWLTVELVGRAPNRDAIGAVVKVTVGDRQIVQPRLSAGSYLSQHDHRLHFGLGDREAADRLEVSWPDGARQTLERVRADRRLVVRQEPPPAAANKMKVH